MKPPSYRRTRDLKAGTSIIRRASCGYDAYVLLRHEAGHAVWLSLETAQELRMEEGRVDEAEWVIVEEA